MKELEEILKYHAGRYPKMQPADAVKLIYQNEFGGGHLIRDEEAALRSLRREYETVEKDPTMPLYEEIGSGIVRVNLAAVREGELHRIGEAFLSSAAAHKGTLDSFRKKLGTLRKLTAEGSFAFGTEALEAYLAEYEASGFPMVSHSPQYRDAYQPAYRIILHRFLSRE